MEFGKRVQLRQSVVIDFAARLTNTSQQAFSRSAERPVLPARILRAGFAFPSLEDPLQLVIRDPPTLIELTY
jgi:hypothetical protein